MNAELIQTLKDFFATKDAVILALVYGSQITEWYKPGSDVDIAVAKKTVMSFDEKCELQLEISQTVKKEIDLLDIQSIAGLVHYEVFTKGICVKEMNEEAWLLYHKHTMTALYWYEDYYPIYSREQKALLSGA